MRNDYEKDTRDDYKSDIRNEYKREETSNTTKLSYLIIGGGIGAVLALLFAPKSGQELRGDIADVSRKGLEKGKEKAAIVGEKAGDYYEVTREKAAEFYQTAQGKAGELAGRAKGAVSSGSNPLSEALEAGKQAYQEEKNRTDAGSLTEISSTTEASEDKVKRLSTKTENKS
jgi:gas vesicle protein